MQTWLEKLPMPRLVLDWLILPLWHAILRLSKPEVRIVTGGISFYALFSVFPLIYLTLALLFSLLPHDVSDSLSQTVDQVLTSAVAPLSQADLTTIRESTPQGLTLHWFAEVLSDPEYLKAIRLSLILAVSSTTLSLVLGVAAAWAIHSRALPGSEAIASFLMAPLVFPSVVIGVALLQYGSLLRLYGGTGVLIAAHVVITVPYIVRAALSSLGGVDRSLEEAARVLEGIVLDSPHRQVKTHYKVDILVRIASL